MYGVISLDRVLYNKNSASIISWVRRALRWTFWYNKKVIDCYCDILDLCPWAFEGPPKVGPSNARGHRSNISQYQSITLYYYTTNDVTSYITLVKTSGQYIHILTAHKLYINLPEILFYSIYVNESVIYYGFHP